ncbi:MAG: TetR/AcrR family transcriptional regulator [Bacilli bacterium]|nr:TetR/AcrR family transcriptional regulator [Erysipelotrichia bacterium]
MQQLKDNVKNKIMNNARKLFYKNGYHNTTMRQIALASAITVGNIYRYFANKKVLFNFIVKDAYEALLLLMDDASREEQLDILDPKYLYLILDDFILISEKYRQELVILIRRYLDEGHYPLFLKLEKMVASKISEGLPNIEPKMLSLITYMLFHGILFSLQTSSQKDIGKHLSFMVEFLFKDMKERVMKL